MNKSGIYGHTSTQWEEHLNRNDDMSSRFPSSFAFVFTLCWETIRKVIAHRPINIHFDEDSFE